VTTATTAKSTTPAAVHQWIRSAIHAWQQLLCGTTGKSLFKNGGFPVRKLLNGQRGTNQVATKPAKCYVFSSQCHGTTCLPNSIFGLAMVGQLGRVLLEIRMDMW